MIHVGQIPTTAQSKGVCNVLLGLALCVGVAAIPYTQVHADYIFSVDGFEDPVNIITEFGESPIGLHTFIAIGSDGLPIISFSEQSDGTLRLIKCDEFACDGESTTISVVDEPPDGLFLYVGWPSSIAISLDGFPVIAYGSNAGEWRPLIIAKCNDLACSGDDELITVVDNPEFHVGFGNSIAIGSDGFPVISHITDLEGVSDLRVTKCNDPACAGNDETSTTLLVGMGGDTSLAIGNDGFPVIAVYDRDHDQLHVVKCDDLACEGGGETITMIANDIGGDNLSLAIGNDGFPVIAYRGNLGPVLKVIKCNDTACAGGDETTSVVDNQGQEPGQYPDIAIAANGNPIIAYWDRVGPLGQVVVASCNDPSCSGGDETIYVVDGPSLAGQGLSLQIGSDGLPIMSYLNPETNPDSTRVLHCRNVNCVP